MTTQINLLTGLYKSGGILITEIDQLTKLISELKASQFLSGLTNRSTYSAFSPELWVSARSELDTAVNALKDYLGCYWDEIYREEKKHQSLTLLLISIVIAILIMIFPYTNVWKKLATINRLDNLNVDLRESLQTVVKPFTRGLLAIAAGGAVYIGAEETGAL